MKYDNRPCCAAEALRRIRQIPINGIPTGICMLDESIAFVRDQDLASEPAIREALLKRVKVYNYVPPSVENHYAEALADAYWKSSPKK